MTPGVHAPSVSFAEPVPPSPATSLESLLIRFRLITSEQLDEALREKRETGEDVGAIVVERGWVNEDQLARLLSYAPAFATPAEPVAATPEPVVATAEPVVAPEPPAEAVAETHSAPPSPLEVEAVVSDSSAFAAVRELEARAPAEVQTAPFAAGPVVSAESEPTALESAETPTPSELPLDIVPALPYEVAPALELVEPEAAVEPLAPAPPEIPAASELTSGPLTTDQVDVPLAPLQPVVEPVAEPVAIAPPAAPVETAPEPEEAQPAAEPETVEPAPEPVAVVAEPAPAPAPAPEPQTVRFIEPPSIETIARVFVRLSNGERVEAGSFDDVGAAKARAEEVVDAVSDGERGWPFFGGRYIRPEAIVSVDVDATVVRYA